MFWYIVLLQSCRNYVAFIKQCFINISPTKNTKIKLFNSYYSKTALPQGFYKESYSSNLSISQSLMDNKLTLSLRSRDIFNTLRLGGRDNFWEDFYGTYSNWEKRYLLFALTYNFNKYKSKYKLTETERGAL